MRMMLGLPVSGVATFAADAHDAELSGRMKVFEAVAADVHDAFRAGVLAWKRVADGA